MSRPFAFLKLGTGVAGFTILVFVLLVAILGPAFAPHPPDLTITTPGATPSASLPLGADLLGRDVLSRLLNGGRTVIGYSLLATVVAYLIGLPIGLSAGYSRSIADPLMMRSVDVIRAFPPLLLFLLIVTAAGSSPIVLALGVAITQTPAVARLAHSISRTVSVQGYVEAAVARGETAAAVVRREILPNIMPTLIADVGLRLSLSILLIAAVNFLGLGLQPPTPDWALMISENLQTISLNVWAVVAPAAMLALLAMGANLTGDAVGRTLGRSAQPLTRARRGWLRQRRLPGKASRRGDTAATAPVAAGEQFLTARDLRIELETGEPVVEDATLLLASGQVLGIVGESGSGKTTAALALLGYARPGMRIARGSVSVAGRQLPLSDERALRRLRGRLVSYVPQDPADSLNPALRIGSSLRDVMKASGRATVSQGDISAALEQVHLPGTPDFVHRFPHQLSGGQQQRVCIAMAMMTEPTLVVLDEPTTGLDVVTQAQILAEIRRIHEAGAVSMVYVSHDLAAVAQIATRIAVMYAGRVIEEGPAAQLISSPRHPYTRGLVGSVPSHVEPRRLHAMPGVAVGVRNRATGCAFATRCPQRTPRCEAEEPALEALGDSRRLVACFEHEHAPPVQVGDPVPRRHADPSDPVLTVEALRASHKSRDGEVVAADGVSFTVARGECVALVGESGSGKTTIARSIVGLHAPDSGRMVLAGVELAPRAAQRDLASRRRCQIVFQNPYDSLNPRRTVQAEIARCARILRRLDASAAIKEAHRLLELVRLPLDLADHYPRELSGGERQRVAIARALAADPALLICDEITSALDVSVQAAVIELLSNLREQLNMSMLFITHDLGVVGALADRVLVLDAGQICEEGAVLDVLARPESDRTRQLIESAPVLEVATAPQSLSDVP